jgi:hypothetical protein
LAWASIHVKSDSNSNSITGLVNNNNHHGLETPSSSGANMSSKASRSRSRSKSREMFVTDSGAISLAVLKRRVLGFNAWLEACFAVSAILACTMVYVFFQEGVGEPGNMAADHEFVLEYRFLWGNYLVFDEWTGSTTGGRGGLRPLLPTSTPVEIPPQTGRERPHLFKIFLNHKS